MILDSAVDRSPLAQGIAVFEIRLPFRPHSKGGGRYAPDRTPGRLPGCVASAASRLRLRCARSAASRLRLRCARSAASRLRLRCARSAASRLRLRCARSAASRLRLRCARSAASRLRLRCARSAASRLRLRCARSPCRWPSCASSRLASQPARRTLGHVQLRNPG